MKLQGDPNRNFLFQLALPLKVCIFDPILVKTKCVWEENFLTTDLGSLIRHSTVCKFGNFPATLILREINFGRFEKVKNCHFNYLWGFEFWFLEKFHTWKCQKFPKIQNSELFNWPIWQSLGLQNDQSWFNVKSEWQKKNPENSTLYIRLHWSVQYTKCRNSNIFLAFRFYVKSILEGLEMPFWQHLGIWIVLIW